MSDYNKNTQHLGSSFSQKKNPINDYQKIKVLGEGAFGEVFLVKKKSDEKFYALKTIDKKFLAKQKKEHHVFQEKVILKSFESPQIIRLFSTFQNESKLNFVMEFAPNRDLSSYILFRSRVIRKII